MAGKHKCPHTDRPIFSKGRCKTCAGIEYMRRAVEKRKSKPLAVYPRQIRQVSEQMGPRMKVYLIISAELKKQEHGCAGKLEGCTGAGTELHHMQGRSGLLLIMSKNFIFLCNSCHTFCTAHSKEAIALGLSIRRNAPIVYEFTAREIELMERYKVKY